MVKHLRLQAKLRMQNPLTSIGSLLGKSPTDLASVLPGLGEQLILTWLKRDLAEYTADAMHEDLLRLRGGDDQAFKRTLALYAGWAQYATTLNDQLAQMNGGQPFTDEPVAVYYPVDDKELQKRAEWQVNSEGEAFVRQWDAVLLPSRDSWVQRVQPAADDAPSIPL
jgi:hypothetical protein